MKTKRLLAVLLAVVMIVSMVIPTYASGAVNSSNKKNNSTSGSASSFENGMLVSSDGKTLRPVLSTDANGNLTVKLEEGSANTAPVVNGKWNITSADKDHDLIPDDISASLAELEEAAEVFETTDKVAAFVVMDKDPLCESYDTIDEVPEAKEDALLKLQDKVISQIEKRVLNGEDLDVRYQFTYLTNAFTIETEFGNLAEIAEQRNVKSVFVMPIFDPVEEAELEPNTNASGEYVGVHKAWHDLGYTGEGMKIAVIDTGLDLDHPSFAADPALTEDSMTKEDIDEVLDKLNAYALRPTITVDTLYRSAKVPFAFNYVDANLSADHSADGQGDHGTHVAGIAAANKVEGTSVVGMAPDAQVIVMKVFGANGGAYWDDICAALEDAMRLGCDVVNASIGSAAGFSSSNTELDLIYERIASYNMVVNFSAGNEGTSSYGNMWGTDTNRTDNPDNATIGSPSTFVNVFSVASAENAVVMMPYLEVAGEKVLYQDSYQTAVGYLPTIVAELGGEEFEYYVVSGVGYAEEFYDEDGNSLVEGKVAVISRGEINYGTKVANAEAAGAVAAIVYNNNDTDDIFTMYMQLADDYDNYPYIPAVMISKADGEMLKNAETKTVLIAEDVTGRPSSAGGQMSDFSSWGPSPDLGLRPDITGIGGNVYSCYDGGKYGIMSGTSMSSPQVAGISALVMQYLKEKYPNAIGGSLQDMAIALMMSTADPIISSVSGVEASPRQQGAGLVDAYEALTSEVYLTVGGERPKAELGDSEDGTFEFSFEIHNMSDEDKTYILNASLLTEYAADYGIGEYFMYGADIELSGDVTFSDDEITVGAGEQEHVTVTITLSEDDKAYFAEYWANGGYVEGYVYLYTEEAGGIREALNLPYMGFYGDWTEAPVFDSAYWYGNSFWGAGDGWPEGDEYYNVMWTDLAGTDWVLGFNPYYGVMMDSEYNVVYDESHNVVSPNGDGLIDGLSEMYISLLRNAKEMSFTYTVGGEVVHEETYINNTKTMYRSNYGQVVPWLYSWYGMDMYDFTDENGNVLPTGTEVLLTVSAKVDYADGGNHKIEIPITVDVTAPQLLDVMENDELVQLMGNFEVEDGEYYIGLQVADETALAAVYLMNSAGTQYYGEAYDDGYTLLGLGDGTYLAIFDVTDCGTEFTVAVCDYAANEAYFDISYESAEDNTPELPNGLYAYRVSDDHIQSDHMYGWMQLGVDGSFIALTDDYLEYAAINAADYVDGYLFGVDAVGNFVVMQPGLWNRKTIKNIDLNVLDMTFDDYTDTMYMVVKEDNYSYLYSVDLLTGETTELKDYGYYSYGGPYTITDDDNGTLYAITYDSGVLYTIDADNDYELTPVMIGEEEFVITDEYGTELAPNVMQSMTYADGVIYWAYMDSGWWSSASALVAIDVEALETATSAYSGTAYDEFGELVEYYPMLSLVALHTLTDTDYQLPEAAELEELLLSETSKIILDGKTAELSVSALPWNYDLDEANLVWTSSDEAVVTVDDGVVTAVGEGFATVTVAYGEVTAECEIKVVNVDSTVYAYNFYSGDGNYGYMVEIDTDPIGYELIAASPVDFVAGDYNGHTGYFYGYSDGGQFWRYNKTTGEAEKLGDPIGTAPVDMAYDYSTGLMYAVTLDYNSGASTLAMVNLATGALKTLDAGYYESALYAMLTLACDGEGNLYTLDVSGNLYVWYVEDGAIVGADMLMYELGSAQYMQSMCWDHENDVIVWAYCEGATIAWIDPYEGYAISLGDPTGAGMFEFVGMHTVPAEIPELPTVPAESIDADDMIVLVGATKFPTANVNPFNATNTAIEWTSSDESILKVNEDGTVTGVAEGEVTLSGTLDGLSVEINVSVIEAADEIYGHVLTDVATGGGQYWVRIYAQDTNNPDLLVPFTYTLYSGTVVDGKLYTVGYDPNSWDANWQFFILDAENYSVIEQHDVGEVYPFVYDMTYDPATATMYAVASYDNSGSDTSIFILDMETGAVTEFMDVDATIMSIAAGRDGVLYAMSKSEQVVVGMDDWGWEIYDELDTVLYAIDPVLGTVEEIGSSGIKSNMMASMAYDYDTDKLYWTPMYQGAGYVSSLAIVDPETGAAVALGAVGASGAQVSGLYILSEDMPEANTDTLKKLMLTPENLLIVAGSSEEVTVNTLPFGIEGVELTWEIGNERVATVDENGVVTGVNPGQTTLTVKATLGGVTLTATCEIAVLHELAAFLSWNTTTNNWVNISRADYTVVTPVSEPDETAVDVAAIANVDGVIYGYDVEGQLFILDTEDYTRENIGEGIGFEVEEGYALFVNDMAYDAANERMLVVASMMAYDEWWGEYTEFYGGTSIYSVDLETGELTELVNLYNLSSVKGLTVDTEGNVYVYSTFDDAYSVVDMETGDIEGVANLQTLGVYGDGYSAQSMYFDELSGILYQAFTSNGMVYRLVELNVATGKINIVGYIGNVTYNAEWWEYEGDVYQYAGLTYLAICEHENTEVVGADDAECTEDGYTGDTVCVDCGEVLENGTKIDALEHDFSDEYESDENGHWHLCERCGEPSDCEDHVPGAPATEENAQLCTLCDYELAPKLPHTHDLTKVDATVTCEDDGHIEYYVCACGKWFADAEGTQEITDHDSVNKTATGHADADNNGLCDACGETIEAGGPPTTGDNILVWVGMLVISIAGIASAVVFTKKKENV